MLSQHKCIFVIDNILEEIKIQKYLLFIILCKHR